MVSQALLTELAPESYNCAVYGEWCGGSVQRGNDAICKVKDKFFAVFAVYDIDNDVVYNTMSTLTTILVFLGLDRHVTIIDPIRTLEFSFLDCEEVSEEVNALVEMFETTDPWVNELFGIDAPGEGVVVSPVNADRESYSRWTFKAKTKAHSVNKAKKPAQMVATPSGEAVEFAEQFATEQRFNQAISELGIDFDMKNMGHFLKWVSQDIQKESVDELEASGLEWKDCAKQITNLSKQWFMKNTIA